MKKNGRLVCINGTEVTITGMDYVYPNSNTRQTKFNITFNVVVNGQSFTINFSNEWLSAQTYYLADNFVGVGDSYHQFLSEIESNTKLQEKKQFSEVTRSASDEVIGDIAQSVYINVKSHSPDQDEE